MTMAVHILAGSLALAFGFVALYAAKGARVHRKSGMLFVYAMLPMCAFGIVIAVVRGVAPAVNIPAALLTAYLVITALTTVRPLPGVAGFALAARRRHAGGVGRGARRPSRSRSRRSRMAARGTGCRRFRSSCSAASACWRARAIFG